MRNGLVLRFLNDEAKFVPALTSDVRIERDYLWWLHEGNRAIHIG